MHNDPSNSPQSAYPSLTRLRHTELGEERRDSTTITENTHREHTQMSTHKRNSAALSETESNSNASHADITTLNELSLYCEHLTEALEIQESDLCQLIKWMEVTPGSPNKFNAKQFILRKECTFALPDTQNYSFGSTFKMPLENWPELVKQAFHDAQRRSAKPNAYTGVHVNYYKDGAVGLAPHADNEKVMDQDMSIYSYTCLCDVNLPRMFSVYKKETKEKIVDIPLGNGDLVIMKPGMQQQYLHGLEKQRPYKAVKGRINLTVRAFKQTPD